MTFQTIIVEDDEMAAKSAQLLCKRNTLIKVEGIFQHAKKALAFLEENPVDLILLDVELPDATGIDLIQQLSYTPYIIIITSDPKYAFNAFKENVEDFIVKPIDPEEFDEAIKRVAQKDFNRRALKEVSAAKEIYLRSDGKLVRVPIQDIIYFENVGDYIKVITNDKNYIIHGALKSINQKLNHPNLLKVHRSFIINMDKIKDIVDNSIVVENKKIIPVSRAHRQSLITRLNIL